MTDQDYNELVIAHLDTLTSKQDTVFIGFKLGSTSSEVERQIKELQSKGKLGPKKAVNFTISGESMKVTGYSFDFFIGDKRNESLINFYYDENGRLTKLDANIYKDVDQSTASELTDLYLKKYSLYKRVNVKTGNTKHFWIKDNVEITLDHFWIQNIILVSYRDLTPDKEKFELEKKKKRENAEKSKSTINDI